MELISLNRSALLVPTPGQTEQEYLAAYLSVKGWFAETEQDRLAGQVFHSHGNIPDAPEILLESEKLLRKALDELLQ